MNKPSPTQWPDDVLARYLTVGGAHVDITHTSRSGLVTSTCHGCKNTDDVFTDGSLDDPPEQEDAHVDRVLPDARDWAQAHADFCRTMPRPQAGR
ncbi:hypothetical protein ABZV65_19570 [Streptomyces bauhiniae]|uniref:hypothetical protein n=1 Tax=Streptomyces bauhiniae TaxID=2340725 RepID=UPI0033BA98FD